MPFHQMLFHKNINSLVLRPEKLLVAVPFYGVNHCLFQAGYYKRYYSIKGHWKKYINDIIIPLIFQGFLAVGELDPLNRRLGAQKKPDVVVQVVIIAEDNEIRDKLAESDLHVQTIAEVAPIEVQPARVLSHLYTYLGRNRKLGLTGRKSRDVGILSTSKLYSLKDRIFAFTPQVS